MGVWRPYSINILGIRCLTIAIKNAPVGRSTRNKLLAFVARVKQRAYKEVKFGNRFILYFGCRGQRFLFMDCG